MDMGWRSSQRVASQSAIFSKNSALWFSSAEPLRISAASARRHSTRAIRTEAGSSETPYRASFERLPHEPERGGLVPRLRDVALEHLALLVDRSPQVVHLAVDLHIDL